MTPPRFDMYAFIHKALRAQLTDTLVAVGRMDVHDDEECRSRLAQVRTLAEALESHLAHEDAFIHPAIEARMQGASHGTAADHLHHAAQIEALRAQVAAVETAQEPLPRAGSAHQLYLMLADLVADNLRHMAVEERQNNRMLQAVYSDAELIELHDRLVASIPPQEMALTLRWLLPQLTPSERAGLLGTMSQSMPPEAFTGVLSLARQHLTGRDWFKLMTAIGPVPQAA